MFGNCLGQECGKGARKTCVTNYTEIMGVRGAVNLRNRSGGNTAEHFWNVCKTGAETVHETPSTILN
jgi:hypothetical protein